MQDGFHRMGALTALGQLGLDKAAMSLGTGKAGIRHYTQGGATVNRSANFGQIRKSTSGRYYDTTGTKVRGKATSTPVRTDFRPSK